MVGCLPRSGGEEKRGGGSSNGPRVVRIRFFFGLVADWSQPYVILEAARQRGKEDLDGTPTTRTPRTVLTMDTDSSKLSHGNSPAGQSSPQTQRRDLSSGRTRFPVSIPHLSSMSSALARYESFLIQNVSTISSLESALRSISWLLPGRFKDAELVSEGR